MFKNIKKIISIAIIVVFAASIAGGCAKETSSAVAVSTAAVQNQTLQVSIPISGVLMPEGTVTLSGKLTSEVVMVNAQVGDTVKKGDTLIMLDTKQLDAQLAQANAALNQANAAVNTTKSTASSASSAYKVARGNANTAKINYDAAQKAFVIAEAAYKANPANPDAYANYLKAQTARDVAKSQYDTAKGGGVGQARYSSNSAHNNVTTAEAAVDVAEANVNLVLVQMENAQIASPVDGVITNRNINPGELAVTGSPLITIMQNGSLKLKGTVSQKMLPMLSVGQSLDVNVDIYPDKTFAGKITMIAPMSVTTGEYFPIEVSIPGEAALKPGLSAHANIIVKSQQRLTVPSAAVVTKENQSYVYVLQDGLAKQTAVTTGLTSGADTEILSGLSEGQEVICTQTSVISDNMPVRKA